MNKKPFDRNQAIQRLNLLYHEASAQSGLFNQLVADRLGLTLGEVKCLHMLLDRGPMVVSALACDLRLTAPAATAMLDKLEDAGFVSRERSTNDRRRVNVRLRPEQADRFAKYFHDLHHRINQVYANYDATQLQLILDFTEQMKSALKGATENLQNDISSPL